MNVDDAIPFNAGNGAVDPNAPMTTQERKIWAASKGLPKNYLIVTVEEMMSMRENMMEQAAQTSDINARFKRCLKELGDYWRFSGNLENAIADAVFDAEKFKKACELSAPKLQKIKDRIDAAIKLAGKTVEPVVFADLVEASADLGKEFVFIVEQMAKRRGAKK